ncbi:hypothetical protein PENSPDRAFT_658642 [Peniophora sp. CONT]|nr:hypothetical protein PENSPDRAFT_658642 [Peniophora sp. CONT]
MPALEESETELTGSNKPPTQRKPIEGVRSTDDPSLTPSVKFFDAGSLPTEILCEILDDLNDMDDKPPNALCCFMRVSRRFRDIAYAAHELWAAHALAPLCMKEKGGLLSHERQVISLVSLLAERSKPALLSLQLPTGMSEYYIGGEIGYQFPNLVEELLSSLLTRARCVSTEVGRLAFHSEGITAFWSLLQSRDMASIDTLAVSTCYETSSVYTRGFPFALSAPNNALLLPSLCTLRLHNLLPPCPFPGLHSLCLRFDSGIYLEPSPCDFLLYLRGTPQLTHLVLDQCLLDARTDMHSLVHVELPRLVRVELSCASTPCTFFLEHVHFPMAAVFLWDDTQETREPVYDVTRLTNALRVHLSQKLQQHTYRAVLRISDVENPSWSEELSNEPWSSWGDGPYIIFSLYCDTDAQKEDNPIVRLDIRSCHDIVLLAQGLSHLLQPSGISTLTIACVDNIANAFFARHASEIIHSFAALKNFTWLMLTTPEHLAPVISAVLEPLMMPLLRSLHIRVLGQRTWDQWDVSPSVIALCEGLRARRKAGCPLSQVPRIENINSLESGSDEKKYKCGAPIAPGERLDELWDMLAEAQGC